MITRLIDYYLGKACSGRERSIFRNYSEDSQQVDNPRPSSPNGQRQANRPTDSKQS